MQCAAVTMNFCAIIKGPQKLEKNLNFLSGVSQGQEHVRIIFGKSSGKLGTGTL